MNKRNWISALLAVMMVISMMACIVVPVAAEETVDLTNVANVTTVTAAETGAQSYKVETAADFVWLSTNYATCTDTDDVIYIANDIDINDYEGGKEAFYNDFVPIASMLGSIDGLGHTIYNWYANGPLFKNTKQFDAYIKNLTFDGAVVDYTTASATGLIVGQLDGNGSGTRSLLVENVHVRNTTVDTVYTGYSGIMFGGMNTNNLKSVTIRNCSVIGSSITTGALYGVGAVIGRIKCGATFSIEDVLVAGCTINANNKSTEGGGLLIGDVNKPSTVTTGTTVVSVSNVGIFNNVNRIPTGATAGASCAIVTNAYSASPITISGVYAAGNTVVTDEGTTPFTALTASGKNTSAATIGSYKVDSGVVYEKYVNPSYTGTNVNVVASAVDADYAFLNEGITDAGWGFDAKGNMVFLADGEKAPVKVTFTADGNTDTYYTDLNGNVRVVADEDGMPALADAADITALGTFDWKSANGEAVNAGADWTKVVVSEDTDYTKVSLPPYTMTLDKDTYVKGDIVTATVSLVAGSNLQGVEVGFNYDENVLTPVADAEGNYAIAANGWLVTDKAESENMMAVTAAAISGENATEAVDVFSVKFKVTQDLASTASELAVTAVLEYAGGLVGDVMTELDLEAYTTVEIAGAAEIKNNDALDEYYTSLPKASTAVRGGESAYQIDSVAELIRTNMNLQMRGADENGYSSSSDKTHGAEGTVVYSGDKRLVIWNFDETDTVYLTADLDIANWEVPDDLATYDEATGLYTPVKIGVSTKSKNFTYVANDGTYTDGVVVTCETEQELFGVLYNGFAIGWQVWAGYCVQNFTFDGLGHTIKNYKDNHAFFFGNYTGYINNVTFENASVTPAAGGFDGAKSAAALITCGTNRKSGTGGSVDGVTMTNVHIKDSVLTVPDGWTGAAFFMCESNNKERALYLNNCSLTGSTMKVESDQSAYAYSRFGFVVGYRDGWMDIKNCIFEDSHIVFDNATAETANTAKAPSRQTLLIGSWNDQDDDFTYVIDNVAVVNCGLVAANADASAAAILINPADFGASVKVSNIYASGNTVATSADAEPVAIPNLVATSTGAAASVLKITASSVLTDAGVTTLFDNKGTKTENANTTLEAGLAAAVTELEKTITEAHWRVNADGSLYLLGQEVTFKSKGEEDMVRYTSRLNEHILYEETENGFVAVDPALFTKLTNNYWYDAKISKPAFEDFIEVGYDWENETYAEDITYVRVPNASEATKNDGYTVYVIPTVDELIAASNSETYKANKVTFPSKEDSFGGTNGRAHGGFIDSNTVRGDFSTYNTIYITNDLDIAAWEAATGRDFGAEYDGWKLPDSDDPNFWTTAVFVLDGMNHTIKGYEDNRSFIAATLNGVLRNITFVDGTVTATETTTTSFLNNAVEKGGTVYENVHLKGCDLTTVAETTNYVGLFAALGSNNVRPATYKNCSIDACNITAPGTVSQIGLFQGGHRTSAVFTMENCYAVDSTITVGKLGATNGHGLLLGNVYNTTAQSLKLNNVAAVNCNFKTLDAEAANVEQIAVVTRVNELATAGSDIGTIVSYGNTKTYTSNEEEVTEPIDYLFRDTLGTFTAQDAVVDGEFIVDSTVKAAINNESDTENVVTAGSLTVDDTLVDLASVIAVMNSAEATADWYLDNGNYVPACAMNGTVGERLNVGHNDIADVINNAKSGDTVKVCLDQEAASTVAIPAGVTVELNGAVLDAIVGGDGYVNDNTDGKGGVTGLGTIGAANAQLPLNDKANGVYRLYNVSVVAGTDSAIDGYDNARKFRVKLNFTNKDAYTLVAAGTSGLTLQAVLSSSALDADVTYTFKNVVAYAQAIVDNPTKNYSLVLNVYGVDAVQGTNLNITYNAASYGAVKSGAAAPYAVPAVEA